MSNTFSEDTTMDEQGSVERSTTARRSPGKTTQSPLRITWPHVACEYLRGVGTLPDKMRFTIYLLILLIAALLAAKAGTVAHDVKDTAVSVARGTIRR